MSPSIILRDWNLGRHNRPHRTSRPLLNENGNLHKPVARLKAIAKDRGPTALVAGSLRYFVAALHDSETRSARS